MVIAEWREEPKSRGFEPERLFAPPPAAHLPLAGSASPANISALPDSRSILSTVLQTVSQVGGDRARNVDAQTNILELGLDSLERLEIANRLEHLFGGVFPEESLVSMETCGEVARAVDTHLLRPKAAVNAKGEIPAEYYRIEQFPEYRQLRRTMKALCSNAESHPYFRTYAGIASNTTMIDGRQLLLFSGYNYLGLSGHPAVTRAARQAISEYGTSVSASRLVSGQRKIHCDLEEELAEFLHTESALTFVGGHSTNVTTIDQLLGPHDLILHDALSHNSIIQGARLSGAQRRPFPHNDWRSLEQTLAQTRSEFRRVLIAIEGAYSMDGDFPELPRFVELRNRYRTLLLVDEAHSLGTMGPTGRGIGEHFSVDRRDVDLWMGTFSKALGSCGGYIAGSRALIEFLKYTASGFVYSVGMSPSAAAAALEALRVLRANPQLVRTCQARSKLFLEVAKLEQLDTGTSQQTPVIPVIVGNSAMTLELSDRLLKRGVVVHPILHPAVEESATRLRFFVTATHTEEQIRKAVQLVAEELRSLRPTGEPSRVTGTSARCVDHPVPSEQPTNMLPGQAINN
jgi:8-amino-7-oxononanoate synthase